MDDTGRNKKLYSEAGPEYKQGRTGNDSDSTNTSSSGGGKSTGSEGAKEKLPGLASVAVPIPELPKKRTRKSKEKVETNNVEEFEKNLTIMLMTISTVVAARLSPKWAMLPEEARAIAKPGARILDRLIPADKLNQQSDYILLAIGLGGYVLPRVIITKPAEKGGKSSSARQGSSSNRTNDKAVTNTFSSLSKELPAYALD